METCLLLYALETLDSPPPGPLATQSLKLGLAAQMKILNLSLAGFDLRSWPIDHTSRCRLPSPPGYLLVQGYGLAVEWYPSISY